jgi:hypothetical protein
MKAVRHQRPVGGERQRAGTSTLRTRPILGSREKLHLVWGTLRLILGVLQMAFAASGILCLIFVGLLSSATVTCVAVATVATLASRALFHGRDGACQ